MFGGPHGKLITDTWLGGSGMFTIHGDQRICYFHIDFTVLSGGLAFEQVIHRKLGGNGRLTARS